MKYQRKISLLIVIVILAISTAISFAIGFDAEALYDSVFSIYTEQGFGTGFAIGPNTIVTNAHVVDCNGNIMVCTYSGQEFEANIYAINRTKDLALLTVNTAFEPLQFGTLSDSKVGDDVCAIGTPSEMALAWTLTKGIISSKSRTIDNETYIQIDAAINPGNSGGPLLNDSGEVIGINTLKEIGSEGIGFSIPVETIKNFIEGFGIETDENGNIIESIDLLAREINIPKDENTENEIEYVYIYKDNTGMLFILCGILLLSIFVNIKQALKIKENNIKNTTIIDPTERTDFDIEIEE